MSTSEYRRPADLGPFQRDLWDAARDEERGAYRRLERYYFRHRRAAFVFPRLFVDYPEDFDWAYPRIYTTWIPK